MAEVTLTDAQHGGSFAVRVGDLIVVALPENPATGYRWSAGSLDESLLGQEGHDFQVDHEDKKSQGRKVGSGGTVMWRFRAKGEGRTRLELKKIRSWEPSAEPAGQFAVSLEIKR